MVAETRGSLTSYEAAAIILLLIMNEITLLAVFARMDGAKQNLLPRINVYGKRIFRQTTNRLIDLSTGTTLPDIPPSVEDAFYRMFLNHHNDKSFKLTEAYWKDETNYWKACGGSSVKMLQDMLAKSEREGVTKRQNPTAKNSPRVLASMKLLREKATHSPATASPTAKTL